MEKVSSTIKIHTQIISFLIIWAALVLITKSYSATDLWPVLKQVPLAISIYVVVGTIFVKWVWRWKIFQLLIPE